MRYLSSLPLRARSSSGSIPWPTDPLAIQQRAQPSTCVLSLASVTVSMASTTTTNAAATAASATSSVAMGMDMEVDPFRVSVPLADVTNTGGIPFPSGKRTHSLLRATPPLSRDASENEDPSTTTDENEPQSPPDPDFNPPRKRTRTSALSSPSSSKPRSQRCSSNPHRVSVASVHLSGCAVAPSRPAPPPPSCMSLMAMKSSASSALSSSVWVRRRMMPGEMRVLLYLYRTLVYGLEVRRQSSLATCQVEQREETLTEAKVYDVSSPEDSGAENARLDVQEALLAQHLKAHLLANGAAAYMLVVNTESVAQEGSEKTSDPPSELTFDSADMLIDVDDASSDPDANDDPSVPFLHPHIHPSTTHTVLSYQQLVATLFIRQTLYPRRPSTKLSAKKSKPDRPGSKLSQSASFES